MLSRNTLSRTARQLRLPRASRRNTGQCPNSRRGYANASDAANKAKEGAEKAKHGAQSMLRGELPWALGATLVTVPTTYMILANGSHGEEAGYPGDKYHGSEAHEDEEHEDEEGGGDGEEGEKAEGGDEEEGAEEKADGGEEKEDGEAQNEEESRKTDEAKPAAGGDEQKEEGGEEKSEGGDEKAEGGEQRTDENQGHQYEGKNVNEQPAKNELSKKTKSGEDAKWTDTVELDNGDSASKKIHKPDAKGGAKRRIESSYGNKLGHTDSDVPESHATSGQEATEGSITKKTVGLSNTETKHSIDIANDPEKSKKGDGTPETAKSMGTIDARKSSVR